MDRNGCSIGTHILSYKPKIRIGMEAAYAPYNWQVSEASKYTIPIDNVQGAYADGYDVQIAKIVCKALGGEPVSYTHLTLPTTNEV